MTTIRQQAQAIAVSCVGFGIEEIIAAKILEYLIPAVIQCWLSNNSVPSEPAARAAALQAHLDKHWDAPEAKFDDHFVRSLRPEARHAAIRQGSGRLRGHQLDGITVKALMKAKTNDLPTLACMVAEAEQAASAMPSTDDPADSGDEADS